MSSFTTQLILTPVDGETETFYLREHFRYRIGERDSKQIIEVPNGFITDGASIPGIVQNILSPWGQYGKAAVLHDFLYKTNLLGSQKASDQLLLEAMEVLGVSKWQRVVIYRALRIGGWVAWNNYRKNDASRIAREQLVGFSNLNLSRERKVGK